MYQWTRNTHLFLGLFSILFLLMYGASSVQMAHDRWFNLRPAVTESRAPIRPENGSTPRTVARELMDDYKLRSELA